MHLQDGIMEVGKMKDQHWYDDEEYGFCKEEAIIQHWKTKEWLCMHHSKKQARADRYNQDHTYKTDRLFGT